MNLKLQSKSRTIFAFLMALFSVWGWGQSITIDLTSVGGSANIGSNAYANGAERTWTQSTVGFGGKAITAAQNPNAGAIQFQGNNGVIYNTTAIPGRIKTIQVNQNASSAFTLSGGTSRLVNNVTGTYTVGGTSAGSVTGTTWTSADLSSQNYTFFALRKGSGAGYITSIVITYEPSTTPNLSITGTFNNFSYVEGNGPSTSQSVSISGTNLDNSAVNVSAPTNYEVSLTNANDFADSKQISYSGGSFTSQAVYVRLKSGLASGSYTGSNLTVSGGNASAANVALNGSVVPPPPANDLCSSATALISGNTLTGSMVNATATSGLSASATKKDVWYKYTALNSGNHIVTANFASGVDLDIHIYTGACPASGSATFVGQTVGGTSEVLSANLVSGTDYYIRVIDYDENATTFTINLQEPLPCVAPAIVTNLNLTPTSSSIAGTFTANTASGYMVVLSTNSALSSSPVNGTSYNVGDAFGGGTVIKYSAGATFTASNLNQSTNYHFFVFSYNTQCIGEPFYNGTSLNGTTVTLTGPCLSEDFTGWSNAYGNWTRTTSAGTWTAVDSFSGGGQIQMNDVGDYLELPLLNNPSSLSYDGALSSSPSSNNRIKVQYYNGTSWVDVIEHTATSTTFASFTATFPSQLASMTGVRVRLYRSADDRTHYIDNVQVFCATPIAGTTWTNSGWSNGTPSATVDAIISSNYSGSGFVAQNLTIDPTYTLTINNGQTITASNVSNNGNIIVNDGGNFVQTTGGVYTAGTGSSFISNRNSASVGGKYVFWSSPVANQNMYTAYVNGSSATAPTYVMTYDTATNLYPNVTNDNANFTNNAGRGYSVKVPANNATVAFGGSSQVPNNGAVNVALAGTAGGINNFNLIGNPYPSNIDLNAFYSANQSLLNSTFWFWDNTTGNVTTQTGNTSVNVGYATVNAADPAGNTWVEAPGTQTYNNTVLNATGNIAKVGQGFIVKALDAGNVSFTNAMRSSSVGGTLNKNAGSGKFWIKLTTSYGNTVTQAITYSQGALDAYDVYDSKAMGMGSDAFYSLVGAEKLVIQGKSTFHIDDVVQLGNKHFENGNFTISLSHKEGLFANGQDIYLHDKQTGTYTNLQSGVYNFSANAGDFTNRFEIVYKLNVLSTAETQKGTFEVYRDGENFVVRNNKNIQSVEVFDAAGRKIEQVTSNSKSVTVKVQAKGLYILKAVSEGKEYTQKIIK